MTATVACDARPSDGAVADAGDAEVSEQSVPTSELADSGAPSTDQDGGVLSTAQAVLDANVATSPVPDAADAAAEDDAWVPVAGADRPRARVVLSASSRTEGDQGIKMNYVLLNAFRELDPPPAGCTERTLGDCKILRCPQPTIGTRTGFLPAGTLRVQGPLERCTLNNLTNDDQQDCPNLWDPAVAGGELMFSASGGEFPAFQSSLPAPQALPYALPAPDANLQRGPNLRLEWPGNATGTVELLIRPILRCGGSVPASYVSATCRVPASSGLASIPDALFNSFEDAGCLGLTIRQVNAEQKKVGDAQLSVEVELFPAPSYQFEPPGVTCTGTHASCGTFASDEPSSCTRHGCHWSAGSCTGTPHKCADVLHRECGTPALGHMGCTLHTP